jgi:hypothetical protein
MERSRFFACGVLKGLFVVADDFCAKLRARIRASNLWTNRSKETDRHIYGLKCPECGHPEASVYREGPFTILCSRKNQCGARVKTLDLFPDLVVNIERDYNPTSDDPHRPAREYLYSRGLSLKSIEGLRFEYRKNVRKTGSGGILFYVGKNAAGEDVWNGRLFSPPEGEGKTHNQGATAGVFWKHPRVLYDPNKPTYGVESIIDALSLFEMGNQAIALLSAGQDPAKIDLGDLRRNFVVAFDPDSAGGGGLKKWKAAYPDAGAIVPLRGDWNDHLVNSPPGKARERFDAALPEMKCRAELLLAESAFEYAHGFFDFYQRPPGLFEFGRCYWFAQPAARAKTGRELNVSCVSNFTCSTDYYHLDASLPENNVYRYSLKVKPRDGTPVHCSLSGKDLSGPTLLRSAFFETARVWWQGGEAASSALALKIVESTAPVVRQIHVIGHDQASRCMVFRDFLIDPAGKFCVPNSKGFYRISRREVLRPPEVRSQRDVCVKPKKGERMKRIYDLITAAWPDNGPLALAFTLASWFVWAIKPELGFFPFLSLHGDTQTGKSWLVRRLNAIQCLDGEGLPMTKLNTGKGEFRELAKKSGLMIPLLEGNREEKMRFDLESLLTLYNAGNPLQVRAMKTNDLATRVTEFLGTLIFVGNKEPFRTKAQMERVVSSRPFKSEDISEVTVKAFREFSKIPLCEMGWCYIEVMQRRKEVEGTWYGEYLRARNEILERVPDPRIAENHGLLLAFHRLVEKIFGVKNDLKGFLVWLAECKHRRCHHREASMADQFFDALDELSLDAVSKFVDIENGKVYVNLAAALRTLDGSGFKFYGAALHEPLREHPAFIVSSWNHRAYWASDSASTEKRQKRCWVFDGAQLGTEVCELLK